MVGDLRTGHGIVEAITGAQVIVHSATTNGRGDMPAIRNLITFGRLTFDEFVMRAAFERSGR
ncbi:hypothetical protein [Nocardia sp. NPDC003963]